VQCDITSSDDGDLVESFCFQGIVVAAVYDGIPLSRVAVTIAPSHSANSFRAEPTQLTCQNRDDSSRFYISIASEPHLPTPGGVQYAGRKRFDQPLNGMQFAIQWSDGGISRGLDNRDFEIGLTIRHIAGSVEIPLYWNPPSGFELSRLVSWHRDKEPFWHVPKYHRSLADIPEETQFVLAELRNCTHHKILVAALLPLIDTVADTRASLFGIGDYGIGIRIETGRTGGLVLHRLTQSRVMCSSTSACMYEATAMAVRKAASGLRTFCTRIDKVSSPHWTALVEDKKQPLLDGIGFCTWDSYATNVSGDAVVAAVLYLRESGIPISCVIVDDGWQAGGAAWEGDANPQRPALSSFAANSKFEGSLRRMGEKLELPVYAWVTIIGYWGGVLPECSPYVTSSLVKGIFGVGLSKLRTDSTMHVWRKEFQPVVESIEAIDRFLHAYYKYMALHGVAGLKIDAQALVEGLCNRVDNGSSLTRVELAQAYREAIAAAYNASFGGAVAINCMAVSNDAVMTSGRLLNPTNIVWRVSNDHAYPNVEETSASVGWHVVLNGMNSILLGEIFPKLDYDMFRASEWHAPVHATLRVISGGPIYISDATPFQQTDKDKTVLLLSRLVTRFGIVPSCLYPGRATSDCVFADPRAGNPCLFKIWNRNSVNGVLAVFNISENIPLSGTFSPSDIPDFARFGQTSFVTVSSAASPGNDTVQHYHTNPSSPGSIVRLKPMSAILLHVCP
jgi:Raffinose synthase or seed imbibition protein Sip1